MKVKKLIAVNATATKSGGALIILQQFVDNILKYDTESTYFIFSDAEIIFSEQQQNINQIKYGTNSYWKRIQWDFGGLNKYLIQNKIKPDIIISFQNTGVRINFESRQILYYHHPVALFPNKWSIFKKKERTLYMYKTIYPKIVKILLKYVDVVFVQLYFIKEAFVNLYSFDSNKIFVEYPYVPTMDRKSIPLKLEDEYFHIIFPANSMIYKNHIEIVNALSHLSSDNQEFSQKIRVHFTGFKSNPCLYNEIRKKNLEKNFIFEGVVSRERVISLMSGCDLLVFPSYIETFGLPLIEAAMFGLPILTVNLDYAKEVLQNYSNVKYLPINNPKAWADAIIYQMENKTKGKDFFQWKLDTQPWQLFFEEITK
jgi:glycosyltransferase involved in cell wall biosynthesis